MAQGVQDLTASCTLMFQYELQRENVAEMAILPNPESDGARHKRRLPRGLSALAVRLAYGQIPLGFHLDVPPGNGCIPLCIHHNGPNRSAKSLILPLHP